MTLDVLVIPQVGGGAVLRPKSRKEEDITLFRHLATGVEEVDGLPFIDATQKETLLQMALLHDVTVVISPV